MPVFSSGQTALQAFGTWQALQRPDLIFAAGGGIMAHVDGPAAGVRSLQDAWGAAMAGLTLEQAAKDSPALAAALRTYG
jgi:ribulose-bisphosphate carboxylase large chain